MLNPTTLPSYYLNKRYLVINSDVNICEPRNYKPFGFLIENLQTNINFYFKLCLVDIINSEVLFKSLRVKTCRHDIYTMWGLNLWLT